MSFSESYQQIQKLTNLFKSDIEEKTNKTFEQFDVLEYSIIENSLWVYKITAQTEENEKVTFQINESFDSRYFTIGYNVTVSPIA